MANKSQEWFERSLAYWERQSATVNGMLGGLEAVSPLDLAGSSSFIARWFPLRSDQQDDDDGSLALDVGAGIGRVSNGLLLRHFGWVSLVEPNRSFLEEAQKQTPPTRLSRLFPLPFGDWTAQAASELYDLIWIQWVIIYASDEKLVAFLREASRALKTGGLIGLKDNILSGGPGRRPEFDEEDHSVCRSATHLERLFKEAGLEILEKRLQEGMPKGLYPVWMYMLRPIKS